MRISYEDGEEEDWSVVAETEEELVIACRRKL